MIVRPLRALGLACLLSASLLLHPHGACADDGSWQLLHVPATWESQADGAFADHNGYAWYRLFVRVPESWRGSRLLLLMANVDDVDETYFNGAKVGSTGSMPPLYSGPASGAQRRYVIDPDQIRYGGVNIIAVRVYDHGGAGGIRSGPVLLTTAEEAIDLTGLWQFRIGDDMAWAGAADARQAAAFFESAGEKAAGRGAPKPVDLTQFERDRQRVIDSYAGNKNPYAGDLSAKPRSPREMMAHLKTRNDVAVDMVAHEPNVVQPVHIAFDERGRMWVTQYIQYPFPAGLKVLSYDAHLRAIFDRIPPAPPHHFKGADKITIHEDTDGDGVFDAQSTFVEGLNITTSVLHGRGGVWVLNPPYLLFYPDKDRDGKPDGDPVVHLSGFGLEDTHAVANSLTWGPDGWIYGGHGSTCTARVKVELGDSDDVTAFMGQAIWRYHPEQHRFELFAEGGYNTFGVAFDDKGRVYSGTNSWQRAVHFVQGGYYRKGWGKHGPPTNPFAFTFYDAMPHTGDRNRMTHTFVIYGGDQLPEHYRGKLISVNPLMNWVGVTELQQRGSTYASVDEAKLIETDDKWFRPVDIKEGPDGAVYVSDWYDIRITHLDPRDNWDRTRGRIYRVRSAEGYKPAQPFDLATKSSRELVQLLGHANRWHRSTALRLLGDRRDASVVPMLRAMVMQRTGQTALEALWALYQSGGLDEATALTALAHNDPHVRLWTVRLLADACNVSPTVATRLAAMARQEPHIEVRSQLAASAQRLPVDQGLPVLLALMTHDGDVNDALVPKQIWWALEAHITRDREAVVEAFGQASLWNRPMVARHIVALLGQRLTAERTEENLALCAKLLAMAPSERHIARLIEGMETGLRGTVITRVPDAFDEALATLWSKGEADPRVIGFAMQLGSRDAIDAARQLMINRQRPVKDRVAMMRRLAERRDEAAQHAMLTLLERDDDDTVKLEALNALRVYSDEAIARRVIALFPTLSATLRGTAQSMLTGRATWARLMLQAVDAGRIAREHIAAENLLIILDRGNEEDNALIRKHWGALRTSPEDKAKRIDEIKALVASGKGDVIRGKAVYAEMCARCHVLHGEGRNVGPELTGYERDNLDFLLPSIVDPSLAIREEFERVDLTLHMQEGDFEPTVLSGFIHDLSEQAITFKDLEGNLTVIPMQNIAAREHSKVSIMPEGLLDLLNDQQVRDLIAYLQSPGQ